MGTKWRIGDRVSWTSDVDGGVYHGTVSGMKPEQKVEVFFDDGDSLIVPRDSLVPGPDLVTDDEVESVPAADETVEVPEVDPDAEPEDEGSDRDPQGHQLGGFYTDAIEWSDDPPMVYFALKMTDANLGYVKFHGQWRKTMFNGRERIPGYAIDIWAEAVDSRGRTAMFSVDSITYVQADPRQNIRSLNADICAAANRFLYFRNQKMEVRSLLELHNQAMRPQIRIHSLAALDTIILNLKAFRDTAIHCGGYRVFEIEGDRHREGDAKLALIVELTKQALALEGKTPTLYEGPMTDAVANSRGRFDRSTVREVKVDQSSKDALVARLATLGPDQKSEARKIRAALRQMGHRGGARNIQHPPAAAEE